jgi:transcriptional regulator with XRE-family HTH domain
MLIRLSVFAEAHANGGDAMAIAMARKDEAPHFSGHDSSPAKLSAIVGENLRHLRRKQGLSLEQLSVVSGVSRAMLGQIETGKSAPTINLLGRIAEALKVSVASLISNSGAAGTVIVPRDRATIVASGEGGFVCRALFPWGDPQSVEIYDVTVGPFHNEAFAASPPGTKKNLVIVAGDLEVSVGEDFPAHLGGGDAILFNADAPHRFVNPADKEAKAFLVVTDLGGLRARERLS